MTEKDIWRIRMECRGVTLFSKKYTSFFGESGVWEAWHLVSGSDAVRYLHSIERQREDGSWSLVVL